MKKLWDKGYAINKEIDCFTVGNDYELDTILLPYDCRASIAHVKMLAKINILTHTEAKKIEKELERIIVLHKNKKITVKQEDEDCHTTIEKYLIKHLGNLGKKVHTFRSRNDQVLTALRLYYKDEITIIIYLIHSFIESLESVKKKYGRIAFPGFTHTRKAMPSSIALWMDAFIDSMKDNQRLVDVLLDLIDQSPLGTGAGFGFSEKIDRVYTAKLLGFKRVQKNPIYAQISRGKFESSIVHVLTQIMFDLNKLATELILFSMPEFGFVILPREFTTGSSIMPHKQNPDALELIRAYYHDVLAQEFKIKTLTSNLIGGYHRDLQLTKEPTMHGFMITKQCLSISSLIINNLSIDKEKCRAALTQELYTTSDAYALVKKGMSFRDAYQTIGKKYTKG